MMDASVYLIAALTFTSMAIVISYVLLVKERWSKRDNTAEKSRVNTDGAPSQDKRQKNFQRSAREVEQDDSHEVAKVKDVGDGDTAAATR